jgi:tetratricopeptide (TPR) repeat protein
MYLPGIGLSIALAWSAARLATSAARQRTLAGGAVAVIVLLMVLAVKQTWYWGDDERLWRHSLATTADNSKAEEALAAALNRNGDYDEAIEHYRRAKQLRVYLDGPLLNSYGVALAGSGRYDEAIEQFHAALKIDPRSAKVHENLGSTLNALGQPDAAIAELETALALRPTASAHATLAGILAEKGDIAGAVTHYRQSLDINPNQPRIQQALASLLDRPIGPPGQ